MKMQSLDITLASGQHSGSTSRKIGFFCGVTVHRVHGCLRFVVLERMGSARGAFKARRDVCGVPQDNQQKGGPGDEYGARGMAVPCRVLCSVFHSTLRSQSS